MNVRAEYSARMDSDAPNHWGSDVIRMQHAIDQYDRVNKRSLPLNAGDESDEGDASAMDVDAAPARGSSTSSTDISIDGDSDELLRSGGACSEDNHSVTPLRDVNASRTTLVHVISPTTQPKQPGMLSPLVLPLNFTGSMASEQVTTKPCDKRGGNYYRRSTSLRDLGRERGVAGFIRRGRERVGSRKRPSTVVNPNKTRVKRRLQSPMLQQQPRQTHRI